MASKWKGDQNHQLPALQVEPYRLWFEFLKLALTDETLSVNWERYVPWGEVANQTFKQWWSAHWRQLFAVDIGVQVVERLEPRSERELIVRIPLYQDPKRSIVQVKELLDHHGASERLKDMAEGQYHLQIGNGENGLVHPSTRFLRNLPKVRLLFHIYRFWLNHPNLNERRRLEATAMDYFNWADSWNRKIRKDPKKPWNRPTIEIPGAIRNYIEYLNKREKTGRQRLDTVDDRSDDRRQIARYIRKARKLAANVADGHFPGVYE